MTLRPYQVEAVGAVLKEWERVRSTLLVMPTGTGKTQVFSEVLNQRADYGRSLVLAHRTELIGQAAARLREFGLRPEIEMAGYRASRLPDYYGRTVVVASVQTLKGSRLESLPHGHFKTICIDEAHHATSPSYKAVAAHFPAAKVLGVTATPKRQDRVGMGSVFDSVAFKMCIRDAIASGWLCDVITQRIECDDFDISRVRSVRGDLSELDLEHAMNNKVLHQICRPMSKLVGDRSTIVFTPTVKLAHLMAEVLSGYVPPEKVGVIDASTSDEARRQTIKDYQEGRVQFIVNCGIFVEGTDLPRTAAICVARSTKNASLYAQMVGRGTRLYPGKSDCLVLDFVGNSGTHKLATPIDVLGGELPEKVVSRAKFIASKQQDLTPLEALKRAQEQLAKEQAVRDAKRRARSHVVVDVDFRLVSVDTFGNAPASDAQRQRLAKEGVTLAAGASARQARQAFAILAKTHGRVPRSRATEKQMNVLRRAGLRTDLSKYEASKAITALADNRWQPNDIIRMMWGAR